jgi:hypothetical protein
MKKYNIVLIAIIATICSCKKDKDLDEPTPTPIPLEKAIIGKWIQYKFENGTNNIPPANAAEFHFLKDSLVVFKDNGLQPTFVCNAKYSINKFAYPETLGYFQIVGTPGQCNTSQVLNLKMISINDSTFTASRSFYTGYPPDYFTDEVSKFRKFQ